ncbi:hypothetical protein CGRA01v4_08704 [Colletotrichum graminicola]|nr:hypothetical protein CGRA01v4_08704 [Colletotrichum graminicola]
MSVSMLESDKHTLSIMSTIQHHNERRASP